MLTPGFLERKREERNKKKTQRTCRSPRPRPEAQRQDRSRSQPPARGSPSWPTTSSGVEWQDNSSWNRGWEVKERHPAHLSWKEHGRHDWSNHQDEDDSWGKWTESGKTSQAAQPTSPKATNSWQFSSWSEYGGRSWKW